MPTIRRVCSCPYQEHKSSDNLLGLDACIIKALTTRKCFAYSSVSLEIVYLKRWDEGGGGGGGSAPGSHTSLRDMSASRE